MEKKPKVSVVMGAYNASRFMREAIESLLSQTFQDFELIIVDDASKDKTLKIARDYEQKYPEKIKVFRHDQNLGPATASNTAISHAQGKYIANFDSDDIAMPEKLEQQVQFLDKHPDIALCATYCYLINENGKVFSEIKSPLSDSDIKNSFRSCNPLIHSSIMFRKINFESVHFYRDGLYCAPDYDFYLRSSETQNFACLDQLLCYRRINLHSISITSSIRQTQSAERMRQFAREHKLKDVTCQDIERPDLSTGFFEKMHLMAESYYHWSTRLYQAGEYSDSLSLLCKALIRKPINRQIWRFLLTKFIFCMSNLNESNILLEKHSSHE